MLCYANQVSSGGLPIRYFARVVSQTSEYLGSSYSSEKLTRYYVEKMFVEALSSIDLAISQADQQQQQLLLSSSTSSTATATAAASAKMTVPANNHIFINCVTPNDTTAGPSSIADHMKQLMIRFGDKIARLGITHFEMKVICRLSDDAPEVPIRLIATNPTGFVVRVDTYIEVREGSNVVFRSVGSLNNNNHLYKQFSKGVCEWEGIAIQQPYPVARQFEAKRTAALVRSDTLYCYDFLELIESAVQSLWKSFGADRPLARIVSPDRYTHTFHTYICHAII
jgi:Acetyl-CoA carboxylase, central region